ncbi:MAG: type II toxin-antitoxin system HicB family antitoxin [Defluviitaleaceae bacterium]|nr:type II toxin-antitoxin system HicB family antitoxin [Defluviitaleaceae bacterium]
MKYAYPAVFTPEENGIVSVHFPDLQDCYTSGDDIPNAIYMAQDVLNLTLYDLEQDKQLMPKAIKPQNINTTGEQFTSVIAVDTEIYRRFYENKAIRKTLTIPMWLNEQAERENINLSSPTTSIKR